MKFALYSLAFLALLHPAGKPTVLHREIPFNFGPITDLAQAEPNTKDALGFHRGERYDLNSPEVPQIDGSEDQDLFELSPSHFRRHPLPIIDSDTVLVGIIQSGQAHLSNDRKQIYSEFKMTVEEVIRSSGPRVPLPDTSIDVQRPGGRVKLSDGRLIRRGSLIKSMPHIGKRHLLFLKYDPATEDYTVVSGYLFETEYVFSLDVFNPDDNSYGPPRSISDQILKEMKYGESEFLSGVRDVSRDPSQQANVEEDLGYPMRYANVPAAVSKD